MRCPDKLKEIFGIILVLIPLVTVFGIAYVIVTKLQHPTPQIPSIPSVIGCSMRGSVLNSASGVLQIHNHTNTIIPIDVDVWNKETQQSTRFHVRLDPGVTWEIGWTYDWSFEPNEEIIIRSVGYRAGRWTTTRTSSGGVGVGEASLLE